MAFAGSLDGHLRAYATDTGHIIWDFDTARDVETVNGVEARGGSLNGPGPTIVDGMVYVLSGYGSFGFMRGNVLLAFTVEEKESGHTQKSEGRRKSVRSAASTANAYQARLMPVARSP